MNGHIQDSLVIFNTYCYFSVSQHGPKCFESVVSSRCKKVSQWHWSVFKWCVKPHASHRVSKLTSREHILHKKKSMLTAWPEAVVRWFAGVSASWFVCAFKFTPLLWCKCVSIKDFCPRTSVLVCLLAFWALSLSLTGCLRDLRFYGRIIPLDGEQSSEGIQVISSQGVSVGCPSEACRKHHCSPPLVCVDLWRHHECRCSKYKEWIPQDVNKALQNAGTFCTYLHRYIRRQAVHTTTLFIIKLVTPAHKFILIDDVRTHTTTQYRFTAAGGYNNVNVK